MGEQPTMSNIRFVTENGRDLTRFRPASILRMRNGVVIEFNSHGSLHNVTDINETIYARNVPSFHPGVVDWQVLHPLLCRKRENS
jgi:hypothetical protein